ncbi:hypothetical protein A3J32_00830 [Candidatus Saccharibacteria bacterium RIFCSPLOWO2_02_FULL_46_7]|nr:MAG: hypothetical protein A3J32_00830 [Candidatus Saccharibacteria bacterium RIFCSPLOWO2_02_FULL_46_7]
MTWNVLYKEKADNILELTGKINPDILCCQEITKNSFVNPKRDIPEEISRVLGGEYRYQSVANTLEGQPSDMGNAIFSKLPIVTDTNLLVQTTTSDIDWSYQNRGYVQAEIRIGQKILTVGTTHLSYVDYFVETDARNREADKLIEAIKKKKEHYILTGDFNSAPDSKTIKRIEKILRSAGPPHTQNTFSTKFFKHNDFVVDSLDWRLDYIFTSPDIKVLSSKIIKTDYSDHLPVLAELQL